MLAVLLAQLHNVHRTHKNDPIRTPADYDPYAKTKPRTGTRVPFKQQIAAIKPHFVGKFGDKSQK